MPLPLAPIAGIAVRYGAVAIATYALTRKVDRAPRDQRSEDAMDDVAEGVGLRREGEQVNGSGRLKRTIRLGSQGPGVEIDATALGRIRFRRV